MAVVNKIEGDLKVLGGIDLTGTITPGRPRSELLQENLANYPVPLTSLRVWDAVQTNIPGTAASDDLAISGGTWGTHSHKITAGDLKAAGATTRRARFELVLPPEYVAGETVTIELNAGMETTVADVSCTCDLEAYVNGADGTIDGSDLVATAATTMNSLTFAAKSFTITATSLAPGSILDVRLSIACNDAATATVVQPTIGSIILRCDIKG